MLEETFVTQPLGQVPSGFVKTREPSGAVTELLVQTAGVGRAAVATFPSGAQRSGGFRAASSVWEWRGAGQSGDSDFQAQFTIVNAYADEGGAQQQLDIAIAVRSGDAFDSGYYLQKRAESSTLDLRMFNVVDGAEEGPEGQGPIASVAHAALVDGTYWMRLRAVEEDGGTRLQGKLWASAGPEPGWQIDYLDETAVEARPLTGYPAIASGTFSTNTLAHNPPAQLWFSTVVVGGGTSVPSLDAPVTVRLGESLTGVFADPAIDLSFFQLVDLPVGSRYRIGDQLSGSDWYGFTVRDRSKSQGIISYTGETLLGLLGRVTPTASLVLVAGQAGVPNPLDLRECLRRFLIYYGVPFVDDLPVFALRVGDEMVVPTVDAFVIQPDPQNLESVYSHLAKFFGPFRGYRFRANVDDQLEVAPPAWVDAIGVKLTVYRRRQDSDRTPVRFMAVAPWSTTRPPVVDYEGVVDGAVISGSVGVLPLSDSTYETVAVGPFTVRVYWLTTAEVRLWVNPVPDDDVTIGSLFSVTFTFRPEDGDGVDQVALTNDDLGPDEVETISADTVVNQAVLNVRRRSFEADQALMQPAAVALRSPVQLMAGAFGNNPPFGPMAWDPDDPDGFLALANEVAQGGTWFWPVDPGVVIQPGGTISVQYAVEEWAEQWSTPGTTPHDDAFKANEYSDSASLPASGEEVKLFDLQFPRESTNFVIGAYGAQGSVYARWRAGEQPGIELRVGNARFVEFGYVPELGPLGSTYYFLWGFVLTLNGTGTTFTVGDLETYRFGFSRALDGLWEGGADVPGLAQSQALYPNRVYVAEELPYQVTPETALAIARGIVEENLTPKTVYLLPIAPSRSNGYAVKPWHLGRAASVPALGVTGRVTNFEYTETNTPAGTTSDVTIEVEVSQSVPGTPASPEGRRFGRAVYRVSAYQRED